MGKPHHASIFYGRGGRAYIQLTLDEGRAPQERNRVGNKRNGFGRVTAPVVSNKPPCSVPQGALKAEPTNNGRTVVEKGDPSADVLLAVALRRYWMDVNIHFRDVEVVGITQQ